MVFGVVLYKIHGECSLRMNLFLVHNILKFMYMRDMGRGESVQKKLQRQHIGIIG